MTLDGEGLDINLPKLVAGAVLHTTAMPKIFVSVFAQHPLRGPKKLGPRGFADAIAGGLFLLR